MTWRDRLRQAVQESGMKHYNIAMDAGISAATLSRILTAKHESPAFETVVRIAHACGASVGWLLDEPGYPFSREELEQLRKTAAIIADLTGE